VLSFFELCAHPRHQVSRLHSALNILDTIVRSLGITYLDANDPASSTFTRNAVPTVDASSEQYFSASQNFTSSMSIPPAQQRSAQQQQSADTTISGSRCSCDKLSLGSQWPEAQSQVPGWVTTPMWNPEWTEGEIKKEECRRLCWSTLMLVSGQTSYSDAINWRLQELFTVDPSNVGTITHSINHPLAKVTHLTCSIQFCFQGSHYFRRKRGCTRIPWLARTPSGRSIFVRCCSGMDASGCDMTPVSATMTEGTLRCAHGSRRRQLKGRCSGIRAMSKGHPCTTDGRSYSSTWSVGLKLHPSNVTATN